MKRALYCISLAAVLLSSATADAYDHGIPGEQALRILEKTKFRVVRRVRQVPVQPLVTSHFLPSNRSLDSVLADRGQPFQSGNHAFMDVSRPMHQLIFAGVSSEYLVLCLFRADWPADQCCFSLIRLQGAKAKEIFFCILSKPAMSLFEVRQLLRTKQFSPMGVGEPEFI